jgi:hypothetical protein
MTHNELSQLEKDLICDVLTQYRRELRLLGVRGTDTINKIIEKLHDNHGSYYDNYWSISSR